MLAAFELRADRLYAHIKPRKRRGEFLAFLRYVRSLYPEHQRLAIILDNFSPHLTTTTDTRLGDCTPPTTSSWCTSPSTPDWLDRIEAQLHRLAQPQP
jgi:hypothetical protein